MTKQEKVGEMIPLVENHDLEGGMALLREAQEKLKTLSPTILSPVPGVPLYPTNILSGVFG
ncbi:MAG: hypothetical protein KFF68_05620, partial [Desulfosarcina sp.]|nr:hypothetical protein [Desulfosarcina sp.]